MVRISIPNIDITIPASAAAAALGACTKAAAVDKLAGFLAQQGPTALLTGAGVSVDSGIRPYRGQDGRYMNPNYQSVGFNLGSVTLTWHNLLSRPILVSHHNTHFISHTLLVSANHRSYPSWFPFSVRLSFRLASNPNLLHS